MEATKQNSNSNGFRFKGGTVRTTGGNNLDGDYCTRYTVTLPINRVQEAIEITDKYMKRLRLSEKEQDNITIGLFLEPKENGSTVQFNLKNVIQNEANAEFYVTLAGHVKRIGFEINRHFSAEVNQIRQDATIKTTQSALPFQEKMDV